MTDLTGNTQQNTAGAVDPETQKLLNTPLQSSTGLTGENQLFLNNILDLINRGVINLYNPETLLNHEVYDNLQESIQGKVDMEAFNLLATIREMKDLYANGYEQTFQMQNLVERIRVAKERLESVDGDVFII